jgi:uncharacterized protein YkwD
MTGPRRLLAITAATVAVMAAAGPAYASCPGDSTVPSANNLPVVKAATLCLINQQRTQAGLVPVVSNPTLEGAATSYSQRMVAQGIKAHIAPDGSDPIDRLLAAGLSSIQSLFVGENLGYATGVLGTPASMVQAWMNSPGHRANILAVPFREIGIGLALGIPSSRTVGATYTTEFSDAATKATAKKKKKKAKKKKRAKHSKHAKPHHRSPAKG